MFKNRIIHFLSINIILLQFLCMPFVSMAATDNISKYKDNYTEDPAFIEQLKQCDQIDGNWNTSLNRCIAKKEDRENADKVKACAAIDDVKARNACFEKLAKDKADIGENSKIEMITKKEEDKAKKDAEKMKWWGLVQLFIGGIVGNTNSDCYSMQISSKVGLANTLVSLATYFFMDDGTEDLRKKYEEHVSKNGADGQVEAFKFLKEEQNLSKKVAKREEMIHKFTAYGYTAASIAAIAEIFTNFGVKTCRNQYNQLKALAHFDRYGSYGGKKMTREQFDQASLDKNGYVDAKTGEKVQLIKDPDSGEMMLKGTSTRDNGEVVTTMANAKGTTVTTSVKKPFGTGDNKKMVEIEGNVKKYSFDSSTGNRTPKSEMLTTSDTDDAGNIKAKHTVGKTYKPKLGKDGKPIVKDGLTEVYTTSKVKEDVTYGNPKDHAAGTKTTVRAEDHFNAAGKVTRHVDAKKVLGAKQEITLSDGTKTRTGDRTLIRDKRVSTSLTSEPPHTESFEIVSKSGDANGGGPFNVVQKSNGKVVADLTGVEVKQPDGITIDKKGEVATIKIEKGKGNLQVHPLAKDNVPKGMDRVKLDKHSSVTLSNNEVSGQVDVHGKGIPVKYGDGSTTASYDYSKGYGEDGQVVDSAKLVKKTPLATAQDHLQELQADPKSTPEQIKAVKADIKKFEKQNQPLSSETNFSHKVAKDGTIIESKNGAVVKYKDGKAIASNKGYRQAGSVKTTFDDSSTTVKGGKVIKSNMHAMSADAATGEVKYKEERLSLTDKGKAKKYSTNVTTKVDGSVEVNEINIVDGKKTTTHMQTDMTGQMAETTVDADGNKMVRIRDKGGNSTTTYTNKDGVLVKESVTATGKKQVLTVVKSDGMEIRTLVDDQGNTTEVSKNLVTGEVSVNNQVVGGDAEVPNLEQKFSSKTTEAKYQPTPTKTYHYNEVDGTYNVIRRDAQGRLKLEAHQSLDDFSQADRSVLANMDPKKIRTFAVGADGKPIVLDDSIQQKISASAAKKQWEIKKQNIVEYNEVVDRTNSKIKAIKLQHTPVKVPKGYVIVVEDSYQKGATSYQKTKLVPISSLPPAEQTRINRVMSTMPQGKPLPEGVGVVKVGDHYMQGQATNGKVYVANHYKGSVTGGKSSYTVDARSNFLKHESNVGVETIVQQNREMANISSSLTKKDIPAPPVVPEVKSVTPASPVDLGKVDTKFTSVETGLKDMTSQKGFPAADSNSKWYEDAWRNVKNEQERYYDSRKWDSKDDAKDSIKREGTINTSFFPIQRIPEFSDDYIERLDAQMKDIESDTDAMFAFRELHSYFMDSAVHSPSLVEYRQAVNDGRFTNLSMPEENFKFKDFLVDMAKMTNQSYKWLLPTAYAKESFGDKAGNVIYGGKKQKFSFDTIMTGGGMIGGALRGMAVSYLFKTIGAPVAQALKPILAHPAGIATINGINAKFQFDLAKHSKKQVELCDKRIALLDDAMEKMGKLNLRYCLAGRDNLSEPECYCYNEDGSKNESHRNSQTCVAYWASKNKFDQFQDANTYGGADPVKNACITYNGQYDPNCKCKKYKDKKTGQNACMKAASSPTNMISLGNAAGVPSINKGVNGIFAGDTTEMANVVNSQGARLAARQAKIRKKLMAQVNKKLIAKGRKPLPSDKMAEKIMHNILKKVPMSQSAVRKLSSLMSPQVGLSGKGLRALKKAARKTGVKSIYARPASKQKRGKEDKQFDFGLGDNGTGQQKFNTSGFMNKKYKYKKNDIVKNSGVSIFRIISNRYQQSGLERLFPDE